MLTDRKFIFFHRQNFRWNVACHTRISQIVFMNARYVHTWSRTIIFCLLYRFLLGSWILQQQLSNCNYTCHNFSELKLSARFTNNWEKCNVNCVCCVTWKTKLVKNSRFLHCTGKLSDILRGYVQDPYIGECAKLTCTKKYSNFNAIQKAGVKHKEKPWRK